MGTQWRVGLLGVFAAAILVSGVSQAYAIMITPNNDTYIDETAKGTIRDAPTTPAAGIYMKGATGTRRVGFMEYTIPNTTVTSATFNATYFRNQVSNGTGAWTFRLLGSTVPASFDETTLTWNIALGTGGINSVSYAQTGIVGGDVALPTGNGGTDGQDVVPNVPVSVDITSYFNAHLGQTIVFKMTCLTTGANAGGTFQDRELSRTMTSGGAIPAGPFIDYVPEPTSMLLFGLGAAALLRRRTA